jgi:CheY-like chemotaxis protein
MQGALETSWKRISDGTWRDAESDSAGSTQAQPVSVMEAQQLETWEDEGGRSAASPESVRILIVDSDMRSVNSIELMLHASGYSQTCVAYSGHAALAMAAEFRPSVVLLELDLLDMSGYEVARLLRGQAQRNDLRLIALTSGRKRSGSEMTGGADFERYLLKPVAAVELSGLLQLQPARKAPRR